MAISGSKLPEFEDPPIVETVMGVKFNLLKGWNNTRYGLFWQTISDKYPNFEIYPPIENHRLAPLATSYLGIHPVRCWLLTEERDKLIQIQHDRFLCNWRKNQSNSAYPRYESIKSEFQENWYAFCDFFKEHQINVPQVQECELTYINHLEKGKEWEDITDLPSVVKLWNSQIDNKFLPVPSFFGISTAYDLPNEQGKLNIQLNPGTREEDGKEIWQLRVSVLGRPKPSSLENIIQWFDEAREYIVLGFEDFTTEAMHELWQKKERS